METRQVTVELRGEIATVEAFDAVVEAVARDFGQDATAIREGLLADLSANGRAALTCDDVTYGRTPSVAAALSAFGVDGVVTTSPSEGGNASLYVVISGQVSEEVPCSEDGSRVLLGRADIARLLEKSGKSVSAFDLMEAMALYEVDNFEPLSLAADIVQHYGPGQVPPAA
jgi:hypothetical protein